MLDVLQLTETKTRPSGVSNGVKTALVVTVSSLSALVVAVAGASVFGVFDARSFEPTTQAVVGLAAAPALQCPAGAPQPVAATEAALAEGPQETPLAAAEVWLTGQPNAAELVEAQQYAAPKAQQATGATEARTVGWFDRGGNMLAQVTVIQKTGDERWSLGAGMACR